ncbi:unnamed protein product [Caenorhabditis bovis]|uniref:GYF domain-containing protein n=1 Tax=Caenorhabditis bovis TaxID=2654633 RepID=A0A8S1EQJ3_9PELO|nr:unnamed protein product [Caenorhabditis bovis]
MRSTFQGGGSGGVGSSPRISASDDQEEYPLSAPVLSNFRYDREELLALVPKESSPPEGLRDCPFFVEISQDPVANNPLTDQEQRLQHNINSSKAMSSLTHAERQSIAAGAAYGGGYSNGQSGGANRGGWTPVKSSSWSKSGTTPDRGHRGGGRGSFSSRGTARGGMTPQSENGYGGTNGSLPGTPDGTGVGSFNKFSGRGRGGGMSSVGRGGSTTAAPYNARAEALYSGDRPRTIASSKSENVDGDDDDAGWTTVGQQHNTPSRPAWGRAESWTSRTEASNAWGRDNTSNGPSNVWKDRQEMVSSVKQNSLDKDERGSSSGAQFNASWSNSILNPLADVTLGMDQMRLAQYQQQQQQMAQQLAQQAAAAAAAAVVAKAEAVEFYYLDPTDTRRGPFKREQMITWFKAGYFSDANLRVQRGENGEFRTIGELLTMNGINSPFDYPEDKAAETARAHLAQFPSHILQPSTSFPSLFGNQNLWAPTAGLDSMGMYGIIHPSAVEHMTAERMKIEEHARRVKEESDKCREMQEEMLRQFQRQQEETQQKLREQETALLRHREELMRKEMEMKEKALEIQRKIEEERRTLEESKRLIEEEAAKKLKENQRLKRLEEERKKEEERILKEKREEAERQKKAEDAAENERRRLKAEAESAAEKIKQMSKKKAEEEAAKKKREQEIAAEQRHAAEIQTMKEAEVRISAEQKLKQISPTASDDSSGWTPVAKNQPVKHTKVAPWASGQKAEQVSQASAEKTLREIQLEEERQFKAEQERLAALRKDELAQQSSIASSGTWTGASTRLQWAANGSPASKPKGVSPWGNSSGVQEPARAYVSPLLDGPSLEAANKIAPPKKAVVKPAAKAAPSPIKKVEVKPVSKTDGLLTWFEKRFKQLRTSNDEIDINLLYQYIMELENPNEVEDIVMSYLDESKAVKEFVREFLKRRIEMRNSGRPDLTSARTAAAPDTNSSSTSGAGSQGKKKKKNQKTVLDGTILGFRGTAASDRLNKGEIDAIPTAPINPSRR